MGATINRTTYTFIRITPRTQPEDGFTVTKGNQFERGLGRIAVQAQESMYATLEVFDADDAKIQELGAPIEDADTASYLYAQARFSTTGYFPPPISGIDNNKFLYLYETGKVIWKDPFALSAPGASTKVVQVDAAGSVGWVAKPTAAPATPVVPSFLSVNSGGSAIEWRDISDLPPTDTPKIGSGIIAQQGGTVAWEEVRNIPPLPNVDNAAAKKWVLTLWSESEAAETTTDVEITKCTNLKKTAATSNYGASNLIPSTGSSAGNHRNQLFEQDLSSQNFDVNQIVKAELRLYVVGAENSTDTGTACIGRMKTAWTEGTGGTVGETSGTGANWNTKNGSDAWDGGAGALNDVDYDLHIYPATHKGRATSGWEAGTHQYFDITELVIDAIQNRNGVLNMLMFWKTNPSATIWINWGSDDQSTANYRPKVRVTLADGGRRERWMGVAWGSEEIRGDSSEWHTISSKCKLDGSEVDPNQPHMHRQANRTVTHNLGMSGLKGVSFVTENAMTKTVGGSTSDHTTVFIHSSISPNDYTSDKPNDEALITAQASDFLFATTAATISAYAGTIDVGYIIWSDTPEELSGWLPGGNCG